MKLNLIRPIAFFDLETTGVNVGSDRIVEIAILKINPDGTKVSRTHRVNPERPIPPQSTAIHGITDEDVKNEPTFAQLADKLFIFLHDCDFGGYNSNKFDIPLLVEEFHRAGLNLNIRERKLVDVQNIFHKMEQRTLAAAYQFYCHKELINAHSALADIEATYEVFEAQLEKYHTALKNDVDFLHDFTKRFDNVDLAGRIIYNQKKEAVLNFGKHKEKPVLKVFETEPSYYSWMMNGDFTLDTKEVMTELWNQFQANKKQAKA